jgi:uncharacterized tellurite resistance protein B-like protein
MHVLLAFLGAIVTALVLLYRLADVGIDLGGLNPFAWRRRRTWRQKFDANPIFGLRDPREIAAVLLVGVAKIDGDLSVEEKRAVLAEFEGRFSMSPTAASQLLGSTVFLLGDLHVASAELDTLLAKYKEHLDDAQIESLFAMIERVAAEGGGPTGRQREMMDAISAGLRPAPLPAGTWG